jgi:hypothetical protein
MTDGQCHRRLDPRGIKDAPASGVHRPRRIRRPKGWRRRPRPRDNFVLTDFLSEKKRTSDWHHVVCNYIRTANLVIRCNNVSYCKEYVTVGMSCVHAPGMVFFAANLHKRTFTLDQSQRFSCIPESLGPFGPISVSCFLHVSSTNICSCRYRKVSAFAILFL